MDDIAKHLGISKKTFYLHFKDKGELVFTMIKNRMELQSCMMDESSKKADNAIHESFIAVTQIQGLLSNLNPMLFYDLKKYHPEAWALFKAFKEKGMIEVISNNILRGIREGYYRENLNIEILAKLRVEQVDSVLFQNSFGSKFSLLEAMTEATEHFLYGLCTLKGHELINKYKNIVEK
ncbi:MAG: TetR/AcrR family transcriptional regulator [Sphingobacteriaceae bacterium]|nr:TetR/AcrR family transcriptional regulator [Sphingobacteriaceae bacterium]